MKNVLVIDDDLASGILVKDILAEPESNRLPEDFRNILGPPQDSGEFGAGFRVSSAASGTEGIELAEKAAASDEPMMLAFIDITLNGMNGLDVGVRLRKIDSGIKIVFLSGRDLSDVPSSGETDSLRKSVFYLQKPFVSSEIRQFATALCEERETEWKIHRAMGELLSMVETMKTGQASGY